MMSFRSSTARHRWRQAAAANRVQNEKIFSNSTDTRNGQKKRNHQPLAQWAVDLHRNVRKKSPRRNNSDGVIEYSKVLRKLKEMSSTLERSEMLEKDFEQDLRYLHEKLRYIDLKDAKEQATTEPVYSRVSTKTKT